MEAHVIICSPTGQQTLSIKAESFSPFVVLSLRGTASHSPMTKAAKSPTLCEPRNYGCPTTAQCDS
jgi:hypothetical protein